MGSAGREEVSSLRPYAGNARTHSRKQIKQIASSIERFGFTNPVLISDEGEIVSGHGRVEAAKLLGMKAVPTLALSHLTAAERRAYVLADNKLALNAGWDKQILGDRVASARRSRLRSRAHGLQPGGGRLHFGRGW
nr:ParB/Srx family N-terminal domain-containing protein [uncultured Sphingosinicella sp.]